MRFQMIYYKENSKKGCGLARKVPWMDRFSMQMSTIRSLCILIP